MSIPDLPVFPFDTPPELDAEPEHTRIRKLLVSAFARVAASTSIRVEGTVISGPVELLSPHRQQGDTGRPWGVGYPAVSSTGSKRTVCTARA